MTFRKPRDGSPWALWFPLFLQFFYCSRPIVLEQPAQRAVVEDLAACLAFRAVIRLILCINDALHGRTADGARMAEATMHSHAFPKCSYTFGETVARFAAQSFGPFGQRT